MTLTIDTVDLSLPTAAADLERALRATGFVQLVGHGVDPDVRTAMIDASASFFALDAETKSSFAHPDLAANRGYRAKGSEALSYSLGEESPPDLFECFNSAPEPPVSSPLLKSTPWPDEAIPGYSIAALDYFSAMSTLASRLDEIIGGLIGAPWLRERSGHGPDSIASIRYEPGPDGTEDAVDGQQRMGAHTDYSSFTFLDADPVPGLQIVGPDGEWVDVIPEPGALLLNVGDMLAVLTNDEWPSTLHRVVPMNRGGAPIRRSFAFFHYPDLDVEISVLPAFVTADRPARYEPVNVEAHLTDKLLAPKDKVASSGTNTTAGRTI